MDDKLICNVCGKEIAFRNEVPIEDFIHLKKNWGYFSEKDGETHELVVCEKCYEELIKQLKIEVEVYKTIEMI